MDIPKPMTWRAVREPLSQGDHEAISNEVSEAMEYASREQHQRDMAWFVAMLHKLKQGDCWCEMGIGNPMVRHHSPACDEARLIGQEYR